jgi:hypothetical protein
VFESDEASPTECDGEYYRDQQLQFPITVSSGPAMFSFDLVLSVWFVLHSLTLCRTRGSTRVVRGAETEDVPDETVPLLRFYI